MIALFQDIRAAFPTLAMSLDDSHESPHVDLNMDVPQQSGLAFAVNLNLQGDELHLSAGAFWVEWFPCTDPNVVARYYDAVTGLLSGRYRIQEYSIGKRPVKAEFQRPIAGGWKTITRWSNLGTLIPWRRSTRVLKNGSTE